jgi:RHH-type rel operon transcriptional repressor/antitoxin RelB
MAERPFYSAPTIRCRAHRGSCILVFSEYEIPAMTLTVRLDPTLETKVDQEARRLGITKSEFVKDAIERVLGLKNPAALLRAVRSRKPMGVPDASENVSRKMRAKLREKRAA